MHIEFSLDAREEYRELAPALRAQAKKQFGYLIKDYRHKSLNIKKYDKSLEIWQGRINKSWRFYFHIIGDIYFVFKLKKHPK